MAARTIIIVIISLFIFIYLFMYLFIYVFIYLCIYLFIYLFIVYLLYTSATIIHGLSPERHTVLSRASVDMQG